MSIVDPVLLVVGHMTVEGVLWITCGNTLELDLFMVPTDTSTFLFHLI